MAVSYRPPAGDVAAEAAARAAADEALQDALDALDAAGASDAELAAAVSTLNTAVAAKQDASTAATDAEVTAAIDALSGLVATDIELAAAVATINTALGLKQDASTAATDAELAAHVADTTAVHGIADTALLVLDDDARLSDDRDPTAHTHPQSDVVDLDDALTDAKARANHTGTQASGTISDFTEAVQDAVAALLGEGSNITLTYNDALDTLEIAAAGGGAGLDEEAVRDAIGVALIGAGLISVAVNDVADTITISTTATANDTNANLRDRATHTGAQAIATVTGLQAALDALQPLDGDLTAFAALTPSNDDVVQRKAGAWTNRTPAQVKTDLALAKGDVGLGNVDNTSDVNKPVSTAQQTALDLKATEATRTASGKGFVNHGATAGTARPTGYASVEWVGSVEPTNAVNGDTWVNTA